MSRIGVVRVGCIGTLLVAALAMDVARAQSLPKPGSSSNACKLVDSDDDDDDDDDNDNDNKKPKPAWKRFAWEETCFEISGELSVVYQKQRANASRIPLISSRTGSVTNASELTTFNPSLRIDTTRNTALGELKTGFEVENNKTSAVSPNTVTTLSEAIVTWAGVKAGYTDSQMNFWDGDFEFSATVPDRTVGFAGYEFKLGKDWTLTFAYETGLPTSQSSLNKFVTIFPEDPAGSARLYYEADDVSFQLAGLMHRLTVEGTSPLLTFLGRPTQFTAMGWVATAGVTLPAKWGQDGNSVSVQATYAVNSAPYLGTNADRSSLNRTIVVPVTTEGWSVVGSYHHVWSKHWESNVMASYLALDLSTLHFQPSVRTRRYAANLIWKPVDEFKIGAEVGYVESDINLGGPFGLLNGTSGKGLIGYLYATWGF